MTVYTDKSSRASGPDKTPWGQIQGSPRRQKRTASGHEFYSHRDFWRRRLSYAFVAFPRFGARSMRWRGEFGKRQGI